MDFSFYLLNCSGIDSLFTKINCDRSPIVEMLGDAGVTETNMMQVRNSK